jgi:hypothetical protein
MRKNATPAQDDHGRHDDVAMPMTLHDVRAIVKSSSFEFRAIGSDLDSNHDT